MNSLQSIITGFRLQGYTFQPPARWDNFAPPFIAKPVVVRADGEYYLCVLPADCKVDLYAVQKHLEAKNIHLVSEHQTEHLFGDSELGAEPPMGSLYDLPTLMDTKLAKDKHIVFQAGSHERAIWMSMSEYKRLTDPAIFGFGYPESLNETESVPFDPFFS